MPAAYKRCIAVWLCLMLLLLLTFGSAYLRLGIWNSVLNLAIAALKAGLVAIFFMRLGSSRGVIRIAAVAALFTLTLLFSLSGTDYATRIVYHAPWHMPSRK
jgi:cytochrome c oxidase subunit IV